MKYSHERPIAFGLMERGSKAVHSDFAFMFTCDVLSVTFLYFFLSFPGESQSQFESHWEDRQCQVSCFEILPTDEQVPPAAAL